MKKPERKINTKQLYSEQGFIGYCMSDERTMTKKLGAEISPAFLLACENDGLIKPLHTEEQKQTLPTGEVVNLVKFYSPFQIFMVSVLCKNIVDENGLLRDIKITDLEYQKEHKTRYIGWGDWMGFNVDREKNGSLPPPHGINHFSFAKDFHNFLKLLHSLENLDRYKYYDPDKMRLYQNAPQLQYDLTPFRDNKKLLSEYSLWVEKLKVILKNVGYYALNIDPLEEWYYYIQRHSQQRRDEFKGLASVAQDLYALCNIITEIIEIVSGKKLPPFVEFIHSDFLSFRSKKNEYATGDDIVAIKGTHAKLLAWIKKNRKILERIALLKGNEGLMDMVNSVKKIGVELDDFEKRYGDVRYVGSYRTLVPSDIKVEDLDEDTKKYLEMFRRNRLMNRIESDDDSEEEDADEPMDFSGAEITHAIMDRLGDLKRKVSDSAYGISNAFNQENYRIENEKRMAEIKLQMEYFSSIKEGENPQTKHIVFWKDVMPKARKVFEDEMKSVDLLKAQLHGIGQATWIVFCAECRKRPVVLHQQHWDRKISDEAICDECLSKIKDLQSIKGGEWYCGYADEKGRICNTRLYKFAYNNILNTNLQNTSAPKITLDYGRIQVEIACPKCRKKTLAEIDWGWLP